MDDHYDCISKWHDRAIEIGSAVWNNLKSKWFYANDDKELRQRKQCWFSCSFAFILQKKALAVEPLRHLDCSWEKKKTFFFTLDCHNHSSPCQAYFHCHILSVLFIHSRVYSSQPTSVPRVIDACVWWQPTANLHQKSGYSLQISFTFSSCRRFACTSGPSPSRVPASVIPVSGLSPVMAL